MLGDEKTLRLNDFRADPVAALDATSPVVHVSIADDDGDVRAVILSPAAFRSLSREVLLARDVLKIRELQQADRAFGGDTNHFFAQLDARLSAFSDQDRDLSPVEFVKARYRIKIARFYCSRATQAVMMVRYHRWVEALIVIGRRITRVANTPIRLGR